jgi:hypothetical protein
MMVPNHCVLYKILLTQIPLVLTHFWPWPNQVWHEQEQAFSWNSHVDFVEREPVSSSVSEDCGDEDGTLPDSFLGRFACWPWWLYLTSSSSVVATDWVNSA